MELPTQITYHQWKELQGANRWYHADNTPRTLVGLDHNWKPIYDIITKNADILFDNKKIFDCETFTQEFLAKVPIAWMKFKTSIELYLGTLTGDTIDPDEFKAGYERITHSTSESDVTNEGKNTQNNTSTHVTGESDDNTKSRGILYNQGVQAYDDEINNSNIGLLGNDFASSMQDNVQNVSRGAQTDTDETDITNDVKNKSNSNNTFDETVNEKRINYYDQLAFLRDRMDRLDIINNFTDEFIDLFTYVNVGHMII